MTVLLRNTALVLLAGIAVVSAIAVWALSRPIPDVRTPATDEPSIVTPLSEELSVYQADLLKRLDELPIEAVSPTSGKVYRLIYLPSFANPVVIRIAKTDDRVALTKKVFDGKAGFGFAQMGRVSIDTTINVRRQDFDLLHDLLVGADFSALPFHDPTDEPVQDGERWYFESRDEQVVHRLTRITPKPKLLAAFKHILHLAAVEPD